MRVEEQFLSVLSEDVAEARQREQAAFDEVAGPCSRNVVLYGAGNLGRKVLRGLRAENVDVLAFADADPARWGSVLEGVPLLSPQDAVDKFATNAVFVVCVWHPERHSGMQDIINTLRTLGAQRVCAFVPLFWKYADRFLPYVFWDLPSRLLSERDQIEKGYNTFTSEESRRQYVRMLQARIRADFSVWPEVAQPPAYFPQELFRLGADDCFTDCGAFDGDTVREFIQQTGGQFRRIVAFEPDPANFEALTRSLNISDLRGRLVLHKAALAACAGKVRFAAIGGDTSAVTPAGEVEVDSTTLDEAVASERPTFIKMDIEGSERDALLGGRRIIAENKPILAVSIYHNPNDLWSLPLLMKSVSPESHFYLRMYWRDGWDTVCFAVPPHRDLTRGIWQ